MVKVYGLQLSPLPVLIRFVYCTVLFVLSRLLLGDVGYILSTEKSVSSIQIRTDYCHGRLYVAQGVMILLLILYGSCTSLRA